MQKNIYTLLIFMFISSLCIQCHSQQGFQTKINGVSFVASRDTIQQKHIDPVLKVNANWTSIMPFAFMKSIDASKLYFNNQNQWYGEREEGVKQSIEMMHKNNIKVMLKPQIWIGGGDFTGFIKMKSEEDWKIFEKQYAEMIIFYAEIAEKTKSEMYCIGTELNSFVSTRPEFWKDLISEVKKVYKGKLTYAENWDKIESVEFWDALDFIGVDAYFPISEEQTPQLEQVKEKWLTLNTRLQTLSDKNEIPILFTEYGYRSLDYAGKEPWNSERLEGQINEEAQAVLLKGMFESTWNKPWFAGGFLWKWFHDPQKLSDRQANRFCVHGKPAERLVMDYYKRYKGEAD
jgi:hypothetical protein